MTETNIDVNPVKQRHWLYGVNAILLVIVGIMILVFLMISADYTRGKAQWDMTSNGTNSLSGSSKKLLADINDHKQNFHIVSLFTDPSNEEKANGDKGKQAEKRGQVMDLLNLYHKNSPYIQVDDWGDKARDDIEKEIRDKYAEELKPYESTVKGFDKVAEDVSRFAEEEAQHIASAMEKANATTAERAAAGSLQTQFQEMPADISDLQEEIHNETNTTLPDWQDITKKVKGVVDGLQANISLFADLAKAKQLGIPPAILTYLTDANDRYKALNASLTAYLDELNKLKPLKVQDVLSGLGRNTIVVLGPDQAKVLSGRDIYADARSDATSDSSAKVFKGEELISSSLLAMARPEKVKVIYVTAAPQGIMTSFYAEMTSQLQQANFDVQEWSPPGAPTPDQPSSPEPPAQGKGVIWIVFPPEAPSGQVFAMPPDAKPLVAAVKKHLDAGGQAMFMATPSGGAMAMMGGGSDGYPFADLLTPYGIEVKPKYSAVELTDQVDEDTGQHELTFMPYIVLKDFEDHPITSTIQGFPTAFFPTASSGGRSPEVTVVDIAKAAPSGAEPKVIVKTPGGTDYWGETDVSAQPKYDANIDMPSPLPLAAVSILHKGQANEQRVVVFGCKYIGSDPVLKATQPMIYHNQLVNFKLFPGNAELVKNSVLWLAGYENMIAVSSSSNAAVRFTVSDKGLTWLRITAVFLLPVAVLILGALIWAMRHR